MRTDPNMASSFRSDRGVTIECECGAELMTLPPGRRLVTSSRAGGAASVEERTCFKCEKTTKIRTVSEGNR